MIDTRSLVGCFKQFLFVFLFATSLFAQQTSDSLFVEYLLEKKYYNDALHWTKHRQAFPYYRGLAFYNQLQLDSAIKYFEQIPIKHPNYAKSRFLEGIGYTFLKRHQEAQQVLTHLSTPDTLFAALRNFQLAGLALLRRDTATFVSYQKQFDGKYFAFSQEEENLSQNYRLIQQHKRKSPAIAGLMSAIVPGSGKIYAGKTGQGLITFIQNLALGLQAYEAYRRDGWKSPRFLVYGGLFTFFYVGNIWGSTLAIHIRKQEFNDKVNEQILFNMQIPIRTVFNQ
jgi:TM2 domain-containing membrane protein YozV